MTAIRWAYAINQWKPQFDDFVRREQHERALKTISIAGFEGVELTYGTGRWEPLGNPQQLAANFGSVAGFREFLRSCAIDAVSSWYWDPAERSMEDLTGPLSPLSVDDVPAIVQRASSARRGAGRARWLGPARPAGAGCRGRRPAGRRRVRPARCVLGGGRPGDGGARRPDSRCTWTSCPRCAGTTFPRCWTGPIRRWSASPSTPAS